MWEYSSVLLSDYFTFRQINRKTIKSGMLATIWLLANTIVLSIFSGLLYETIIRGQIIDKIEDEMDLITKDNWKSSLIITGLDDLFYENLLSSDSQITRQLLRRAYVPDLMLIYFNRRALIGYFLEMMRNNAVISGRKLTAHLYLREMQRDWPNIVGQYMEGLDYGISKTRSGQKCYYFPYNKQELNESHLNGFNTM